MKICLVTSDHERTTKSLSILERELTNIASYMNVIEGTLDENSQAQRKIHESLMILNNTSKSNVESGVVANLEKEPKAAQDESL